MQTWEHVFLQHSNVSNTYFRFVFYISFRLNNIKDTHRKKARSDKTPELAKIRNMGIWVVGTSI